MSERPNTISGLNAKKAELEKYRALLEAEIRKITCDIDHIEGALKLFDPVNTPAAIKRYVVRHRAKKGTVKRFILEMLRTASRPLTSAEITDAWVEARALRTDRDTLIVIRKRIGAALISMRNAGLTKNEGVIDGLKGWRVV
jgi:hypothetical protein